jgi:hypothetical protein
MLAHLKLEFCGFRLEQLHALHLVLVMTITLSKYDRDILHMSLPGATDNWL